MVTPFLNKCFLEEVISVSANLSRGKLTEIGPTANISALYKESLVFFSPGTERYVDGSSTAALIDDFNILAVLS